MGLNFLSSIGNNLKNEISDVLNLKGVLHDLGFFEADNDAEPHGYITRELDSGIKRFQKENGLSVDGIIHPKGETEQKLGDVMRAQLNSDPQSVRPPLWTLDGLKEQRKPEVDATGRMIMERDEEEEKPSSLAEIRPVPIPKEKPVVPETIRESFDLQKALVFNNSKLRQQVLLNNTPAKFEIHEDQDSNPNDIREMMIDAFVVDDGIAGQTVKEHNNSIERLSKKHGVDSDLVRAIMWAENARGDKYGWNRIADSLGLSDSQRPMNINGKIFISCWKKE